MTNPVETPERLTPQQMVVPGPWGAVLRALPSGLIGAVGIPLLAWLVPHGRDQDWWALLILVLALTVMYFVLFAVRGPRPERPEGVPPQRWKNALTSARRHRSLPSDPKVRWAAALIAYGRVLVAVLNTGLVLGIVGGTVLRPDLTWAPLYGGIAVFMLASWVQLPSSWAYLRLHAAASHA